MASDYGNLGLIHRTRGDLDKACECWRKARKLYAEIGIKHMVEQIDGWMRDADCPEDDK